MAIQTKEQRRPAVGTRSGDSGTATRPGAPATDGRQAPAPREYRGRAPQAAGRQPVTNQSSGSGKLPAGRNTPAGGSRPSPAALAAKESPAEAPKRGRKPAADKQTSASKKGPAGGQSRARRKPAPATSPLRVIPLGGLNEIGKNITCIEYEDDAFLIDCGMAFPDEDMLGVDIVLPDFTYVLKNQKHIRGIVLTHGHEDHIGSLPYLLKQAVFPVYGTRLTLALVEGKLREHGLAGKVPLHVVKPGDSVSFGPLRVEFINVNHSIPDAVALGIHTPVGTLVHTGDFKIDCTPIVGTMIDLARFGELGNEGVLALLADSTNAERPGYTPGERVVGESFANLFQKAENKRIIIATFSSNIHRIQQIIDAAVNDGRKVAVSGRSMLNVVGIAQELGYLTVPDGILIDIDAINHYPKDQIILITTGSQGEPMSALTRMAFSDHRKVEVGPDDYIIISATPIPGNDKAVGRVIDELMKRGCDVIYERMYDVHVSGHACQGELKIMHGLVRPKFFLPVHGEQKHLQKHAGLARSMGMDPRHVLISDIGHVIEFTPDSMKEVGTVQAGRVLVDGFGIGDVGSVVLRDRKHLAEDGLIVVVASIDFKAGEVVSGPDIVSRGFVYVREAEPLIEEARKLAAKVLEECCQRHAYDWTTMKTRVRDELSRMLFQKTKRSPMILPIIMEV